MILISGARSETFHKELRAMGPKLTPGQIRELTEDKWQAEREESDMQLLKDDWVSYVSKGRGAGNRSGTVHPGLDNKMLSMHFSRRQQSILTKNARDAGEHLIRQEIVTCHQITSAIHAENYDTLNPSASQNKWRNWAQILRHLKLEAFLWRDNHLLPLLGNHTYSEYEPFNFHLKVLGTLTKIKMIWIKDFPKEVLDINQPSRIVFFKLITCWQRPSSYHIKKCLVKKDP